MSKDWVRVDFRELLATGWIGPGRLGVPWDEVLGLLGPPGEGCEDLGDGRGKCCYSNLRFIFRSGLLDKFCWTVDVTTYGPSWPDGYFLDAALNRSRFLRAL